MRWYIAAEAVRQYMTICGCVEYQNDDLFDRYAKELDVISQGAKLAKDISPTQRHQQWRVKTTVKGKRTRLELIVSTSKREEGSLPQLIAVRNKGA